MQNGNEVTQRFLVCYDYGMGGIWRIVRAPSAESIAEKLPELTVFNDRPSWMDNQDFERIATGSVVDIEDDSSDFIRAITSQRK